VNLTEITRPTLTGEKGKDEYHATGAGCECNRPSM
jgi:hypothetical protein